MTPRQKQLLTFIRDQDAMGECPSYSEMAKELGVASKGRIAALINDLEERGYITRMHKRARAIQVVRKLCPKCGHSLQ